MTATSALFTLIFGIQLSYSQSIEIYIDETINVDKNNVHWIGKPSVTKITGLHYTKKELVDGEEIYFLFPRRRSDGIGAPYGFGIASISCHHFRRKTDHHKFTGAEPQRCRTGTAERKQPISPVFDMCHSLGIGQGRGSLCRRVGRSFGHG